MKLNEVKNILGKINISDNFQIIGMNWDVKHSRIYDDNNIVLEKGFSIRTTFMRPDVNTGEIEKGYGRWMYVPENVSMDGLVKTAWVCTELIVKHELMEAFLYERKRIFDPHKSLKDLQYNSREVNVKDAEDYVMEDNIEDNPTVQVAKKASEMVHDDVREPKVIRDGIVKPKGVTESSEEIFHKQNIENHKQEIVDFLDENFKRDKDGVGDDRHIYSTITNKIIHSLSDNVVTISDVNGKVFDYRGENTYNVSEIKDMLSDIILKEKMADSAVINQTIHRSGFTEARSIEDGVWVFKNPDINHRLIVHSETDKSIAIINQNGDIVSDVDGNQIVYENEEYTMDSLEKVLKLASKK